MIFLAVLLIATLASLLTAAAAGKDRDPKRAARWGLGIAFAIVGIAHLANPTPFEQHLPDWTPAVPLLVVLSGIAEIALGTALALPWRHRQTAGRITALYLLAVLPANAYVAVYNIDVDGQPGGAYPWIRLPFQALFIAWALWSTNDQTSAAQLQPPSTQTETPAHRRAAQLQSHPAAPI